MRTNLISYKLIAKFQMNRC